MYSFGFVGLSVCLSKLPGLADTQSRGSPSLGHRYQEALGDKDTVLGQRQSRLETGSVKLFFQRRDHQIGDHPMVQGAGPQKNTSVWNFCTSIFT